MDEVKVEKATLLAKLKDNREKHIQLYKDALEGFFIQKERELDKALTAIKAKKTPTKSISFTEPVNHETQYDEAIAMLEMSVDGQVTLSRYEFAQYVQDSWINPQEKHFMRAMALSSSNSALYQ